MPSKGTLLPSLDGCTAAATLIFSTHRIPNALPQTLLLRATLQGDTTLGHTPATHETLALTPYPLIGTDTLLAPQAISAHIFTLLSPLSITTHSNLFSKKNNSKRPTRSNCLQTSISPR